MQIRITKCSMDTYWYHNKIGCIYNADYHNGVQYVIRDMGSEFHRLVDTQDCVEVLPSDKLKNHLAKVALGAEAIDRYRNEPTYHAIVDCISDWFRRGVSTEDITSAINFARYRSNYAQKNSCVNYWRAKPAQR